MLSEEFPDITVSKIRFLESRGLIHPERSASGYRKFAEEDIGRLRWILRQQRENFLPLKVIKGRLEQAGATLFSSTLFTEGLEESAASSPSRGEIIDEFEDDDDFNQDPEQPRPRHRRKEAEELGIDEIVEEPAPAQPRAQRRGGNSGGPRRGGPREPRRPGPKAAGGDEAKLAAERDRRSAEALARSARVDVAFVDELEAYGLIEGVGPNGSRDYPEGAQRVVELAARLRGYGIEPRHLRTFKHAAERESGVLEQVMLPMLQRRNPEAQQRARSVLGELTEVASQLHDAFVRAALREIDTR